MPARWLFGDGSGGSEERIGVFANKEICYAKCSVRKKNGKLANGVTVDSRTEKTCFCEYGQKRRRGSLFFKNTYIIRGKIFLTYVRQVRALLHSEMYNNELY